MSSQLEHEITSLPNSLSIPSNASQHQIKVSQQFESFQPIPKQQQLVQSLLDINNNSTSSDPEILRKYEQMSDIGVSTDIIVQQMHRDKVTQHLITQFETIKSILSDSETDQKSSEFVLPPKPTISKPEHKTKNIHWSPVALDKVHNSIWDKMNHEWNEFDSNKLVSKFKLKLSHIKLNKHFLKTNVCADKDIENVNKIYFVSAKRSQKVCDALAMQFHTMSNVQLRNAIISMNERVLSLRQIKTLHSIVPTPAEQLLSERLSQIQNIKLFGIAERFFYSLSDIMELKNRIRLWVFKLEFEERVQQLIQDIAIIETAKCTVCLSKELREIFQIILVFGNHLNFGNKMNANAYGFDLSDLTMLQELKTSDNSMTFLLFLCSFLQKRYPNLLDVIERLKIVHESATINGEHIKKGYQLLVEDMRKLSAMIVRFKCEHYQIRNENDAFFAKMVNFQEIIDANMSGLKMKMNVLRSCETELNSYFGTQTTVHIQRVFQYISVFLKQLQTNCNDLQQFEYIKKQIHKHKRKNKRAHTGPMTRTGLSQYVDKSKKNIKQMMRSKDTMNDNQTIFNSMKHLKSQKQPFGPPKLRSSQSEDHSDGNKNIISFGRFSDVNNAPKKRGLTNSSSTHSAIIHKYDYTQYNDYNRNARTRHKPKLQMNGAIVHGYHHQSEPNSPINRNSFCLNLEVSDSQMGMDQFGAVLESPLPLGR